MQGGRISRGFQLAKKSWAVLRADRSLMIFPVISFFAGVCALVLVITPGAIASAAADGSSVPLIVAGVVAAYVLTFVAIFFQVALAACAARSLEGENTSVGQGIGLAFSKLGAVLGWSAVQATVGLILNAIQSDDNIVGVLVAAVINVAWSVITFFVVPVIALEGLGPVAAIKRSAGVVRQRWGEGIVGSAVIGGVVFLIALVPIALFTVGGFAAVNAAPAAGIALFAVAGLVLIAAVLVGSTLNVIFRVALYRFATEGATVGGFTGPELESAFRPKKGRGLLRR
jgi:Family of unknown function (DUF6159)